MRRWSPFVVLVMVASVFALSVPFVSDASAATLYVGGGGPGNYTMIQAAIDAASPGDTVFVYSGTYSENVRVNKTLTLMGEHRNSTLIDGGLIGDTLNISADWVNVTGFNITTGGLLLSYHGLTVYHVRHCTVTSNIFWQSRYGLVVLNSTETTISGNIFLQSKYAIYLGDGGGNKVEQNVFFSNGFGMYVENETKDTIARNRFQETGWGVYIIRSYGNVILGNAVNSSAYGIWADESNDNRIVWNNVTNATWLGISLLDSLNNTLANNSLQDHQVVAVELSGSHNNTIVDNELRPWMFDWTDGISVVQSDGNTFARNRLYSHWYGIDLVESNNNTIYRNELSQHHYTCIHAVSSHGNLILENDFSPGGGWENHFAVDIGGNDNTIANNSMLGCFETCVLLGGSLNLLANNSMTTFESGIEVSGYDNRIASNFVRGQFSSFTTIGISFLNAQRSSLEDNQVLGFGGDGLRLLDSDDNTIKRNVVASNGDRLDGYGVKLESSQGNRIFHNKLRYNNKQAYDDRADNEWDNGYPSGGNYWSDHESPDGNKGPDQDIPGSDCIVDTARVIDLDSADRYPLIESCTFDPSPPRNVSACLSGAGFADVTVSWEASSDEALGLVEGYEVYWGGQYDPSGLSYSFRASIPPGEHSYTELMAGEGNPGTYFFLVCARSLSGGKMCADMQAAKFTGQVAVGPNLVSVPLVQSNESIERVLHTIKYDMAWHYDSSRVEWKWHMRSKGYGDLTDVNHTMGLWVNVTEDSNLTVAGMVPAQTTIHLRSGWNLVSFPSFNSSYTVADLKAELPVERVEGHDPTAPPHFLRVLQDSDVLLAGEGYWVKASQDVTWVVSNG